MNTRGRHLRLVPESERTPAPAPASIFATVGSDPRPFDRLVGWVDGWLDVNAERGVEAYLHTGTSGPPRWPVWAPYVEHDEVQLAMRAAGAVVCDGAPTSILLCTSIGKTPIVIPRSARLGEEVDERQVLHCRRLAQSGRIWLAEREDHLGQLLALALDGGACRR
jgi:UDP-N-acetylglucosamine transferase subunit ALG13